MTQCKIMKKKAHNNSININKTNFEPLDSLSTKMTRTYDIVNPGPGLGQIQTIHCLKTYIFINGINIDITFVSSKSHNILQYNEKLI